MSFTFSPQLLLRMPAMTAHRESPCPDQFLGDSFFRSALYLASPVFYSRLATKGFDPAQLTRKELDTLQKYINRICYRPTPFGLFASVSLIHWGADLLKDPDEALLPRIFLSQECLVSYEQEQLQHGPDERFTVNPTLYRLMDEYRFIRTDVTGGKREYLLQSTGYTSILQALFTPVQTPRSGLEFIAQIELKAGCTNEEAVSYFNFLVNAQLLLPVKRSGITNSPAFEPAGDGDPLLQASSQQVLSSISAKSALNPADLIKATEAVNSQIASQPAYEAPFNVILIGERRKETIPLKWQTDLSDGLSAIGALSASRTPPAMAEFANAFRRLFEDEEVSLLKALDPEAGIAYGPPIRELTNPLLETVDIRQIGPPADGVKWTDAHAFLLEQWHQTIREGATVMNLDAQGIEKLRLAAGNEPIMGMSVLFRAVDEQLWLETAGGVNTAALAGRFTPADPRIYEAVKRTAQETEALYPHVLFAELLHVTDPHTDNVNVRESIWRYEIPLTTGSHLPFSQQLPLADLTLRLEGDKLLLWSVRHRKMVMPRLSTAYNHSLNKLPLFRFLADLPYQFARSTFGFDLKDFFPGVSHYPRVTYRNTILQPATWVLKKADLDVLFHTPENGLDLQFNELMDGLDIPDAFYTGEGDQQMVIFRRKENEGRFFLSLVKSKKEVVIREVFLDRSSANLDAQNPASVAVRQYNAFIPPSDPQLFPYAYRPFHGKPAERKFVPGSEWLYLKIYVPRSLTNRLLLKVLPLLRQKYPTGSIRKWFFIRYEDHAPHIRLRLHLDPAMISDVLQALKRKLEGNIHERVIREYQVDTYTRENERYQAGGYPETEHLFWKSSELVIRFLKLQSNGSDLPAYHFAMITTNALAECLTADPGSLLRFYEDSYLSFFTEFEGPELRADLDRKYREVSRVISGKLQTGYLMQFQGLKSAMLEFIKAAGRFNLNQASPEFAGSFFRSLIHMHLNRLFPDQSRQQEMMTYYLLYKALRSAIARRKQAS